MTDTSTQNTAATPTDEYGAEIHPKHSFSPIEKTVESFGKTFKLQVPETEIQLDDSPTGPNAPVRIYRTRGPWAEPTKGLEGLRSEWIEARGDVEPYEWRGQRGMEGFHPPHPARQGRQARYPDALRPPGHHHPGDGVRGAARALRRREGPRAGCLRQGHHPEQR